MNNLFHTLLPVHILAGGIALVVAPGAMITVKGGLWHRRWGKTVLPPPCSWSPPPASAMSLLRPNLFLFMVAVFSFYLVFSGYRVLHRKGPGNPLRHLISAVTLSMILAGLGLYRLRGEPAPEFQSWFCRRSSSVQLRCSWPETIWCSFDAPPLTHAGGGSRT